MNTPVISEFSWQRAKNWSHLWVNDIYITAYSFTYTIEEALEEFSEGRGEIFKGIYFMSGVGDWKHGTYLWRRP